MYASLSIAWVSLTTMVPAARLASGPTNSLNLNAIFRHAKTNGTMVIYEFDQAMATSFGQFCSNILATGNFANKTLK